MTLLFMILTIVVAYNLNVRWERKKAKILLEEVKKELKK